MKKTTTLLLLTLVLASLSLSAADLIVAKNGRTKYKIVNQTPLDSVTTRAAAQLELNLAQMTEATFGMAFKAKSPAIRLAQDVTMPREAFQIKADGKDILISGNGRGVLFGVYALLEKFGARLYAKEELSLPKLSTLIYKECYDEKWVPVITHRNTHYRATNDQLYVDWHRQNHDKDGGQPSWGSFVHTYSTLCPPEEYFEAHPEYFSLRNGQRVVSQLCLSNRAVLEIVCANLAKAIEKNPAATYWSVSSNDNYDYCQCPTCAAVDKRDGSPTGSVITFANKVAERFPNHVISTLAYQYSRAAPKVTRPLPNVNIMFCSIECNRSLPIAQDSTSQSFVRDMRDWAALTDNIFVWDYVIQFKNLISPFPNLDIIEPNLRFFVDNNVKMLFEQGNREVGGEFAALRSYLISKLMSYPDSSGRAIIEEFCNGYYAQAGKYVLQYIDDVSSAMKLSGERLSIFGSPRTPVNSWLSPAKMADYHAAFDKAEQAVAADTTLLRRVRTARQPLYYVELEQAKADLHGPRGIYTKNDRGQTIARPEYVETLKTFIARCQAEGVTRLSEWHTPPADYLDMMLSMTVVRTNTLSYNRPLTFSQKPTAGQHNEAQTMLVNGIEGCDDYSMEWVGWNAPQYSVTVDLGDVKQIKKVSARFIELIDHWSFQPLPKSVTFYASTDGVKFTEIACDSCEIPTADRRQRRTFKAEVPTQARYVKAQIEGYTAIPEWHTGFGHKATTYMDELCVE